MSQMAEEYEQAGASEFIKGKLHTCVSYNEIIITSLTINMLQANTNISGGL